MPINKQNFLPNTRLYYPYIIVVVLFMFYIAASIQTYPDQKLWISYWAVVFLITIGIPKKPELSLFVFILLAYGTPRYGIQKEIFYHLNILNMLCLIIVLGLFLRIKLTKKKVFPINMISKIELLFIVWVSISLFASLRFDLIKDYIDFNHNPIQYFHGLFLFVIASKLFKKVSAGLIIAYSGCFVILIRGISLWYNKELYLSSDIGLLSAIVFPLCLLIVTHHKQIVVQLIFGFFACFFPFLVLLTQNRTAGVTFLTVMVYLFFLSTHKLKIMVGSIPIIIAIAYAFPNDYWNRFRVIWDRNADHFTAGLDFGTIIERLRLWDIGFEMFKKNIFWGIGPGNYQYFLSQYSDHKLSSSHLVAHNSVVSVASEMGIVGLILYLSLCSVVLYSLLRVIIKSKNSLKAIYCKYISASILGCFCAGMFSSRQDFVFMYLLFGWTVALTAKKSIVWKDKTIKIVSE